MSKRRISIATGLSLLLHASLFVLLAAKMPGCGSGGNPTSQPPQPNKPLAAKTPEPIDIEMVEMPGVKGPVPEYQKPKHLEKKCKDSYGGIGIITDGGLVKQVIAGYPADKAGIIPGMILLDSEFIRGEVGTLVQIKIQEEYQVRVLELVRDKICYEDTP